jgi:hypothetical protein
MISNAIGLSALLGYNLNDSPAAANLPPGCRIISA